MKKITLVAMYLLCNSAFAQTKKASVIYLTTTEPQVTFYGRYPQRDPNAPSVYFKNGASFNDTLIFAALKEKLAVMLPQLGFRQIPEDSVITTANYAKIKENNKVTKIARETSAKGYASSDYSAFGINGIGKYFEAAPNPDIVIDASAYFELNNTIKNSAERANLVCDITIKGFSPKGKKVFKFHIRYTNPQDILIKPSTTSGWGYEPNGDIGKAQKETLAEALKLIDAEMPEQIEKVNKFYK